MVREIAWDPVLVGRCWVVVGVGVGRGILSCGNDVWWACVVGTLYL